MLTAKKTRVRTTHVPRAGKWAFLNPQQLPEQGMKLQQGPRLDTLEFGMGWSKLPASYFHRRDGNYGRFSYVSVLTRGQEPEVREANLL